jgi:hypothetical protein
MTGSEQAQSTRRSEPKLRLPHRTCLIDVCMCGQALHFQRKHACAHLDYCSGRGDCFLGKCFCSGPYDGDRCERARADHPRCTLQSDSCFRHPMHGRPRVSLERWQRASWAEESWWAAAAGRKADTSDHGEAMRLEFRNYARVPDNLGHVIEIGCGPFTQVNGWCQMRAWR